MHLTSVSIENYSIHKNTSVDLQPVTVLIGRNGGGKSALLDALMLLGRTARGSLGQAFEATGPFSYQARLFHGAQETEPMRFDVRFDPGYNLGVIRYELVFGPGVDGVLTVRVEKVTTHDGRVVLHREGKVNGPPGLGSLADDTTALATVRQVRTWIEDPDLLILQRCAYALGRMLRFRFDPHPVGTDAPDLDLPDEAGETPKEPGLGMRGETTASFLYWLRDYNGPEFRALEADVAEVIPGFAGFEFSTARPGRVGFLMKFSDDRETVNARNVSSGTLSVVAILALTRFRGARGPKVLCIEEPELGLTPTTARGVFTRLQARPHQAQFLVTSHSPHILCEGLNKPDTAVLRAVPDEHGVAQVVPVRHAALEELGVPGPMLLKQGGGTGVEAALKLMEGLG